MTFCIHTGLTIPECCCPECLTEQLRRHQPSLLPSLEDGEPSSDEPDSEDLPVSAADARAA